MGELFVVAPPRIKGRGKEATFQDFLTQLSSGTASGNLLSRADDLAQSSFATDCQNAATSTKLPLLRKTGQNSGRWDCFGGCILPTDPPRLLGNGKFQRPHGLPPDDHWWDASRGVWIAMTTDSVENTIPI